MNLIYHDIIALIHNYIHTAWLLLRSIHFSDLLTSFALIVTAEIGDKSQLVCMTLASRHRAMPVLLGAMLAFAFLNALAVIFGAAIALWLPAFIIAVCVALLFALFGIHALYTTTASDTDDVITKSNNSIFFSTLLLITIAEFGDKTQLVVVALGSSADPIEIWLGATAALTFTSALGIIAGRAILQRLPLQLLHRISGTLFLLLAIIAAYRAYLTY